jgi:hypothetical protein
MTKVARDTVERSRAIIPGDDPGDQQPPERRGLYPRSARPSSVAGAAIAAATDLII